MKKFEYMVLNCNEANLTTWLKDCGNDWFELVQCLAFMVPTGSISRSLNGPGYPEMETRFKLFLKKEIL